MAGKPRPTCVNRPWKPTPGRLAFRPITEFGRVTTMWDVATLFRRHQRDLQRFLRRRGISHDIAADISQDTFLRLLTSRPAGEVLDSRGYVFRTATNLSIDFARRQSLLPLVHDSEAALMELPDQRPSAERLLMSRQELAIVQAALDEVPPGPKAVFMARLDGQTFAEIGRAQNIPLKTAFSQMMKVTLHLKMRLDAAGNNPR